MAATRMRLEDTHTHTHTMHSSVSVNQQTSCKQVEYLLTHLLRMLERAGVDTDLQATGSCRHMITISHVMVWRIRQSNPLRQYKQRLLTLDTLTPIVHLTLASHSEPPTGHLPPCWCLVQRRRGVCGSFSLAYCCLLLPRSPPALVSRGPEKPCMLPG